MLNCLRFFIIPILLLSLPVAYAAEVHIYNDLDTEIEGRKLVIENIRINDVPKLKFKVEIYPGDTKVLAAGSVTNFVVSRIFPAHKLKYEVSCINSEKSITLTVNDIHEDKMNGICKLSKYGHWSKRTGTKWLK